MELTQKLTHKHQKIVINIEIDYSLTYGNTHTHKHPPHRDRHIHKDTGTAKEDKFLSISTYVCTFMHPDTSKLRHSTCMQTGIYKDTTHTDTQTHIDTHTLKTFYRYQLSRKQRNLNRHSYRQTPMKMCRLQNGGGGLFWGAGIWEEECRLG